MNKLVVFICAVLLAVPLLLGVSFSSGPQFNSGNLVFTDDALTCAWTYSGDTTTQNITIYREGVLFFARNESGTLNTSVTISSVSTTKNEDWECRVRLNNATGTTLSAINVTIQNSAPETPTIYNSSDDNIGTSYTVTEDTTYVFDANSTDNDGDTLTYYFKTATQKFCTMTDTGAGLASCTPTQSYHNGNPTSQNVTFWVDDDDSLFAKSASKTVTFTVIPFNDAPTASVTNQTTPVNTSLTYDINVLDEEGDDPITFALLNTPSEISSKVSIVAVDNDTGRFTYNASPPDYNDVNTTGWQLTVNITDSNNASTLVNFLLNITAVGRAPEINSFSPAPNGTSYILDQGDNILINITANDSDGNDSHTYRDNAVAVYFNTTTLVSNVNITGNSTGQVNFTATNDDVGQFSVTITVEDIELITDTIVLNFTVNNVNDAPVLHEISTNATNSNPNTNITNLTAFANTPFSFAVNATDIDVQYGDSLTYADNTSLFNINTTTGLISFTPAPGDVRAEPYSVLINVTDNASASDYRVINLTVLNNTPPYFNVTPPDKSCAEGVLCTYNLALYSTDDDGLDYVAVYNVTTNLSSLTINTTTGLVSFTPNQTEVGNYTVILRIRDTKGATNSTTVTFEITNTDDAPILTRYNFSAATIVETFLFTYQLQAQDYDLLGSFGENLTFSSNLSFATIDSYTTGSNQTAATLSFTPNVSQVGTHTVNISVTDNTSLQDTEIFTFTILPDTDAPVIELVQPYPNGSNNSYPVQSFNVSSLGNATQLNFQENVTWLFAHETTDDVTPVNQLIPRWFYDDELVATTWNYSRTFNFTSSGNHNLVLSVNDTYLEQTNFTWTLNVSNLNRPPRLLNPLQNVTNVSQLYLITNYFLTNGTHTHFIDPDDDLDGNNEIDGSETNRLVFTATTCTSGSTSIATLTVSGPNLIITPENLGTCYANFTATDSDSSTVQSNIVLINVTVQPEGEEETTASTTSSGGGGSTSRSSFIPLTRETEKPKALNIIAPALVTVYENNSVIVPFKVQNTWTERLDFVQLGAKTNATELSTQLSSNIIEFLDPNQTAELYLEVRNYRLGNNYEVEITANVSSPSFEDSALILLTSIEQSSEGDDVEVKVTFARDLFNENPECQELNELLNRANLELAANNFAEARRYVDTAINGCKYLVSTLQQKSEQPDSLSSIITLKEATLTTILFTALAFLIISTIAFIIYYHYSSKEEDDI